MVAHRAGSAGVLLLVVGSGFAVVAEATVPALGGGPPVPVWALTPGMLAIFAVGMTQDLMAGIGVPESSLLVVARAGWVASVAVFTGACGAPVAIVVSDAGVVAATVVLVGLTFGVAVVLRHGAALVGSAVVVMAMTYGSRIPTADTWGWVRSQVGTVGLIGIVIGAVAGSVLYAWKGVDRRGRGDTPA